jgi:synaptojanin
VQDKCLLSHVQISGSVPLFWEQKGVKEDVNLTRSQELTKIPFGLHFKDITETYGKVFCINLLKSKTAREDLLTQAFKR